MRGCAGARVRGCDGLFAPAISRADVRLCRALGRATERRERSPDEAKCKNKPVSKTPKHPEAVPAPAHPRGYRAIFSTVPSSVTPSTLT